MSFDAELWCSEFLKKLQRGFSEKLIFVGIQGSYGRGEAKETSDIDVVVVLDELSSDELDRYAAIVASMPFSEKACGFICGEAELRAWSAAEKFLLFFDTSPLLGSLEFIAPQEWDEAAAIALKEGACEIYHGACHNRLYEKEVKNLAELYKSAFFVARIKHFLKTKRFVRALRELVREADDKDKEILLTFSNFREGLIQETDFITLSDNLIKWSSEIIVNG